MRWTDTGPRWKRRFAFFPVERGRERIWLEWYWSKWDGMGEYVDFGAERPE